MATPAISLTGFYMKSRECSVSPRSCCFVVSLRAQDLSPRAYTRPSFTVALKIRRRYEPTRNTPGSARLLFGPGRSALSTLPTDAFIWRCIGTVASPYHRDHDDRVAAAPDLVITGRPRARWCHTSIPARYRDPGSIPDCAAGADCCRTHRSFTPPPSGSKLRQAEHSRRGRGAEIPRRN